MSLTIHVYGKPAPQGSKRHVGNGVMVESSKAVKPWREAVKAAALDSGVRFPRAPIALSMSFYVPRPRSHYRTGKNAHLLRDAAPFRPVGRPDLDKLIRSTCDALTDAGTYPDDSCVVTVNASKFYADERPAGAEIDVLIDCLIEGTP